MHSIPKFYGVYLLKSTQKDAYYIGSTPNPQKRIRQHNGDLSHGAFRTKRAGYRPWKMIIIVSGFPSNVSALQFEHAFQHSHLTRHIKNKIPGNHRSVHQKLANLKLLLKSEYFSHLHLVVNIFDGDIAKLWEADKYKMGDFEYRIDNFDEFVTNIDSDDDDLESIKLELMRLQKCQDCSNNVDMDEGRLVTKYQGDFYHLTCLSRLQSDLVPYKVGDEYWVDLVKLATRLRGYFSGK